MLNMARLMPDVMQLRVMRAKPNRPITDEEATIVRAALERCAETPDAKELLSSVSNLHVVDQCQCGCPSVDFARSSSAHPRPIADGLGITSDGNQVGVIIWGASGAITGLEIYDGSASASELKLQDLKAIIPWEEGAV
jgi:hypothetical protein